MNLRRVDLNLLTVFEAILTEQNITRAAASLGMSQPAMSNALARLRELLKDPLFVRTGRGMLPTERAKQLAAPVREALALIQNTLSEQWLFDYATASHAFHIAMSDYCESVLLPRLLDWLEKVAPGISITVSPISERTLARQLSSGEVDLAIGNLDFLDDFPQQRLLEESFVAVVRVDHPQVRDQLSLKLYTSLPHVVVAHPRRHGSLVDAALAEHGLERRVAVTVRGFLTVPVIIANTNLIATVPLRVAQSYATLMGLKVLQPPVTIGAVNIRQFWHGRSEGDPAQQWLRRSITEICQRI